MAPAALAILAAAVTIALAFRFLRSGGVGRPAAAARAAVIPVAAAAPTALAGLAAGRAAAAVLVAVAFLRFGPRILGLMLQAPARR